VTALTPSVKPRHVCYRGMSARSHALAYRLLTTSSVAAFALALASCSFSYQLDNLFAKAEDGMAQHSGSLRLASPKTSEPPSEGDLRIARAVASDALTKGSKDISMTWENPATGARGTITPLASAYTQDGNLCRDFLASYVRDGSEAWLHGAGCRAQRGKWEVRSMRPWRNTSDKSSPPS
jgi:surface antigen